MLTLTVAKEKESLSLYALSGLVFGLAILTKETAFFLCPAILYFSFKEGITSQKLFFVICFAILSFMISFPWFYSFYKVTGTFFADKLKISEESTKMFPFVKMVVNRPWYFYFIHTLIIAPIYIFGYFNVGNRIKNKRDLTEVIWIISYFLPLTIYGMGGQGYQTRYILPAILPLSILSAENMITINKVAFPFIVIFLAYGFLTGIFNSILSKPADLFSIFYFLRI